MKLFFLTIFTGSLLFLTACGKKEEAAHDHPMACAKCDCKAMVADPAEATKCKSCSHLAADHTKHVH